MSSPIVVIDYGLANIRSVVNALSCFKLPVEVAEKGSDLDKALALVLPGVGSYDAGMRELRARGHVDALEELVIGGDKPFLGICLGLQFALQGSEEGDEPGLGWIPAVAKLLPSQGVGGNMIKVPHIGWNEVEIGEGGSLLDGIDSCTDFYFNHSYYFPCPEYPVDDVNGAPYVMHHTSYGLNFVSALEWKNISLAQFHPEKSQLAGMKLLENFVSQVMNENAQETEGAA